MVVGEIARPVDLLVIGGGPGGYTAAARAAELGREVVLIESGRLGGVCLNVGCIPSKALITLADLWERSQGAEGRGLPPRQGAVDMVAAKAFKDGVVGDLVDGVAALLKGVEVVQGVARLLDDRRVSVESGDQVSHFQFDACILATGSRPIVIPGLEPDGERVVDSTGALDLTEVPDRMVVVGGGYIGLELGTAYAKLGSHVTIVEALDAVGGGFDADLVKVVVSRLGELGVDVLTGARALGIETGGLRVQHGGDEVVLPADKVLIAVGRVPNVEELQLENAGIALVEGRIPVDAQCRTSSRRIYAIGDLVPGPALAHKAATEGRVAAECVAGLPSAADAQVPMIAFTDPEMSSIGMTEQEAKDAGLGPVVGRARFSVSGRARTLGATEGMVKLVADAAGTVIGVQIVGPEASDLISAAALAVENALHVTDVVGTMHPHPTLGESLHEAATAAHRRLERAGTSG
jgi:dihydrolipoamide dehydrogenase